MPALAAARLRRILPATGPALAMRHPHGEALDALLWDGALWVETPSATTPGRIDFRTLVQLDGDVVTAISPEALRPPAAAEASLERHARALARCRAALRNELGRVTASLGHLWIAGTSAAGITAGAGDVLLYGIAAAGPIGYAAARWTASRLLHRAIHIYVRRLAESGAPGNVPSSVRKQVGFRDPWKSGT